MEPDRRLEVLPVAVAAGRYPYCLDATVEALRAGIAHPVGEVREQAGLVALQGLGRVDDRLEP